MQIEYDEQQGKITVGKWSTCRYRVGKDLNGFSKGTTPPWKKWVREVAEDNGIKLPYHPRDFAQEAANLFKRSPKDMYEHYKKLAYRAFVVPNKHLLVKIGFAPGRIDVKALDKIMDNKEVLEEAYNDKLYNILPILAKTGKRPAVLKKELGKTWKSIANNSANKNRSVAKYKSELFHVVHDKPTTVLNTFATNYRTVDVEDGVLEHVALHYKGNWNNTKKMYDVYQLFQDAVRMANKLELKVDPKWTPRRLKEEHDKMSQEINARRYPCTQFEWAKDETLPKELHIGPYKAVLLDNAKAIADEGNLMGHCVGSYADYSKDGGYVVYSVSHNGDKSSTIGLYRKERKDKNFVYSFNQHYARWNHPVTCTTEKSIPQELLKLMNKEKV